MGGLIDPAQIPVIAGNMAELRRHAAAIGDAGAGYLDTGARVHAGWQALAPAYRAPEAGRLIAATAPVRDVTAAVGLNLQDADTVLTTYANTVEAIQRELDALRAQAIDLRAQADAAAPDGWAIAGHVLTAVTMPYLAPSAAFGIGSDIAEPWRDDPELVARNNALLDAVNVQVAAFTDAERRCANDLRALHGRPPLSVDDGDGVLDPATEYGFTLDQYRAAADQGGLPWGGTVVADRPWHEDVATAPFRFYAGLGDAAVELVLGLGALTGYDRDSGWTEAGDTAGTAWTNLGKLVLAAGIYVSPGGALIDATGAAPFLEPGEAGRILTDTGKALIAYDQWDDDPARASGHAVGNIAAAIFGTKGLGASLRGVGTAVQGGRAGGVAARVGSGLTTAGTALGRLPTLDGLLNAASRGIRALPVPHFSGLRAQHVPDAAPPHVDTAAVAPDRPARPGSLADDLSRSSGAVPRDLGDATTVEQPSHPVGSPPPHGPDDVSSTPDRAPGEPGVDTVVRGNQPNGSWIGEEHGARLDLTPEANAVADDVLRRAAGDERLITPRINQIVDGIPGARLQGYEYVLKSEDSLKRKLATELESDPHLPPAVAVADIRDAVRYTVEIPDGSYVRHATQAVENLQARGFEHVTFRSTWGKDGTYKGLNSTWRDPSTGRVFELQFHTPGSFEAKMITHPLYDRMRLPGVAPAEFNRLRALQSETFSAVDRPLGNRRLTWIGQDLDAFRIPGAGRLDLFDAATRSGSLSEPTDPAARNGG